MNTHFGYITTKNLFYFQVGIGISGNTFLLVIHSCILCLDHKTKPTDVTISLLAVTHIVTIFITVIMMAPDTLGSQSAQNDLTCKAMLYLKISTRGLSICTTCTLSVLQAITICPSGSWLARFKHQPSCCILYLFLVFFVLNLPLSGIIIIYTSTIPNGTKQGILVFSEHCALWPMSYSCMCFFFTMKTFRDGFFMGIVLIFSGYMVIFLCRHKRHAQYLYSISLSPRASPETRATQTILIFLILFVVINLFEFIWSLSWHVFQINDPLAKCFQILTVNGYFSVSSVVLITSYKHVIKMSFILCWKNITKPGSSVVKHLAAIQMRSVSGWNLQVAPGEKDSAF